jgi:hypothetical protein
MHVNETRISLRPSGTDTAGMSRNTGINATKNCNIMNSCFLPSEPVTWCIYTECSVQLRPEEHTLCPH